MATFTFDEDGDLLCRADLTGTSNKVYQYPPFLFNENYALLCIQGAIVPDNNWTDDSDFPVRGALGNKLIFTS